MHVADYAGRLAVDVVHAQLPTGGAGRRRFAKRATASSTAVAASPAAPAADGVGGYTATFEVCAARRSRS